MADQNTRTAETHPATGAVLNDLGSWLKQRGGVYLDFATFLQYRADLMGAEYYVKLRDLEIPSAPESVEAVAAVLHRELGRDGDSLARFLEKTPVWSTRYRTAYLSRYQDRTVVVQIAAEPVSEAEVAAFEKDIPTLEHPAAGHIASPAVLSEFRQWLRQSESCSTERSYLDVINRRRGQTRAEYPLLIPELCGRSVLTWNWVEGETVGSLVRSGNVDGAKQAAIALLEQYCSLSVVDGDFSLDSMVITPGEPKLVIRRFNRPIEVPPPVVDVGMKYLAAVLEGNASVAAQTLTNLAVGRPEAGTARELVSLMAASEPELKANLWFPASAGTFESNWRALAELQVTRPLYLNCLHRNLLAVGYWTADAVSGGGTAADTIIDAHWPVLESVLMSSASRLMNPGAITEWAVSFGSLGIRGLREAARFAEEIRDNNLSMEVDVGDTPTSVAPKSGGNSGAGILIACLLVLLLAIIRYGAEIAPSQGVAVVLGSAVMLALFWSFTRLR